MSTFRPGLAVRPRALVQLGTHYVRIGRAVVDVNEYIDEEEHQKRETVEDQYVGNGVHARICDEVHLFLGSAHEEEAGGKEELDSCQCSW